MTSELLPCPFCGGEARFARLSGTFGGIKCEGCNAGTDLYASEVTAITAWNTRAKADQIMALEGEELAALRKFFDKLTDAFWSEQWLEIDGADFQDMAESAGLIRHEPYDPEKHPDHDDAMPGDPWFVPVFPKAPSHDQ